MEILRIGHTVSLENQHITQAANLYHFTDKKVFIILFSASRDTSMKICKFINGEQYQTYPLGHFSDSNPNDRKDIILCKFVSGFDVGAINTYISDGSLIAYYVEI